MTREYLPTASLGVSVVQVLVEKLGWIFRRQPENDYGIDGHLEVVIDSRPTGRLLGVQIKTGKSYFGEATEEGGYVYRGSREHLDYWLGSSLPVLLVLVDEESGTAYWQHVTTEYVELTEKAWKIVVPSNKRIDDDAIDELLEITDAPEPVRRLNELTLAEPWIRYLADGGRVIVEARDWIHKSSGRAELDVLLVDDEGTEQVALSWPILYLTATPFETALREFFPWATPRVDEEFYAEIEEESWIENNGMWDSEDQEYFYDNDELNKYLATRDPADIRPYEYPAGEVAAYRLDLKLNELGRSFLVVARYLHDESVGIRPATPGGVPKRVRRRKNRDHPTSR